MVAAGAEAVMALLTESGILENYRRRSRGTAILEHHRFVRLSLSR
jgi:hypothetical protein